MYFEFPESPPWSTLADWRTEMQETVGELVSAAGSSSCFF